MIIVCICTSYGLCDITFNFQPNETTSAKKTWAILLDSDTAIDILEAIAAHCVLDSTNNTYHKTNTRD